MLIGKKEKKCWLIKSQIEDLQKCSLEKVHLEIKVAVVIVIQHADMQILDYGAAYSLLQKCCIVQAFQRRGWEEQETGNS